MESLNVYDAGTSLAACQSPDISLEDKKQTHPHFKWGIELIKQYTATVNPLLASDQ